MLASLWCPVIALMCRLSMLAADRTVMVVALIEWFVRCGIIPALVVIKRSILSSVLWPRGVEQYHTASFAGLNDLYGLRGFWNKLLHSGLRCDRYFSMSFTGQRFEPGLSNILPSDSSSLSSRPPWWFLVANTAPRSLLISKYFSPLGVSLETSMYFFKSCWFSRPRFPRNRLIKNQAVCCSLCGWSESVSASSPSS